MDEEDHLQEFESFEARRQALLTLVAEHRTRVEQLVESLGPTSSVLELTRLQEELTTIALQWIDAGSRRSSPLFPLIERSVERRRAVKDVIAEATNVGKLFETYARKPDQFSRVKVSVRLHQLLAALDNLDPAS